MLRIIPVLLLSFQLFAAQKRPNIVFLFSDDHAVQAISAYGSQINKTPNIDSIAQQGTVFNRAYCANSICAPSRACILTGKHSHMNGKKTNSDVFDGSQVTFPKLLKKSGYKTAIFGKWHLKSQPTGFDEWMVLPGQGYYYNPDYKTAQGIKRIPGYVTDITTNHAIDFIKRQKEENQPFMLMCQFKAPHRNWMPAPRFMDLYKGKTITEPSNLFDKYDGARNSNLKKQEMTIAKHMYAEYDLKLPNAKGKRAGNEWQRMTEEQRQTWMSHYNAEDKAFKEADLKGRDLVKWKYQRYIKDYLRCIAAVDENVGRILKYLKDNNLDKNTIVVYSSDQGFYLGEHGWYDKRWMYEESFRMPFLIKWPVHIAPGSQVNKLIQNIDFAPTFLEAAGLKVPKDIQGRSLMPLLKSSDTKAWRKSLYYHYYENPAIHNVPRHHGVATERYKLIHYYDSGEWELLDRQRDPSEMRNFYESPEYRQIRQTLHKEFTVVKYKYKVQRQKPQSKK